jgi:hypothetical protein
MLYFGSSGGYLNEVGAYNLFHLFFLLLMSSYFDFTAFLIQSESAFFASLCAANIHFNVRVVLIYHCDVAGGLSKGRLSNVRMLLLPLWRKSPLMKVVMMMSPMRVGVVVVMNWGWWGMKVATKIIKGVFARVLSHNTRGRVVMVGLLANMMVIEASKLIVWLIRGMVVTRVMLRVWS